MHDESSDPGNHALEHYDHEHPSADASAHERTPRKGLGVWRTPGAALYYLLLGNGQAAIRSSHPMLHLHFFPV